MEHLASLHLVHRDLAARNVVVSSNLNVKISNISLCQGIYSRDYFLYRQKLLPLRWMAPEALLEDDCLVSSDVWSFGVFVWEVFSFAGLPLAHKTDDEVLRGITTGENQLEAISGCPERLFKMVLGCTAWSPVDRPSFSEIVNMLSEVVNC